MYARGEPTSICLKYAALGSRSQSSAISPTLGNGCISTHEPFATAIASGVMRYDPFTASNSWQRKHDHRDGVWGVGGYYYINNLISILIVTTHALLCCTRRIYWRSTTHPEIRNDQQSVIAHHQAVSVFHQGLAVLCMYQLLLLLPSLLC